MQLQLGEQTTNNKGDKYLPAEPPVCWKTTQWAEILYEPSNNERVSLCLELTDEMSRQVERLEKEASSQLDGSGGQAAGQLHKTVVAAGTRSVT